ncbi:MAG: LamG-like jellyroll fold domain-containing protein [Sedimentisphaerales bacterium]
MCKRLFLLTFFVLVLGLVGNAVGQPTGKVLIEYWNGIDGTVLSDLYNNARFPDAPDDSGYLTAFDLPYSPPYGDNYGARVRGYLYPPETGDYNFWIASDDASEFLLSTDDDPANVIRIAWIDGWCDPYDWDNTGGSDNPDQASAAPVTLQAGQKYYVEGVLKEGGGGDGIAVAWQGPGIADRAVIAGDYLSAWLLLNARGPVPADGAIDADVMMLEWTAGDTAVSHKVYLSTDATVDESDFLAETQMALQFADLVLGAAYYWRVDEVQADGTVIEGKVWSFTTLPLEAHFPNPANGAVEVKSGTKLSWTSGKGVIMHDVYFGKDEAAVAAGDPSTFKGKVMVTSFDPGAFEAAVTYYWKIDEFAVTGTNPGPVWSFKGFDPDVASEPDPANGAVDVDNMPVLSWMAGETAFLYDVYFGTDEALVAAGDASVSQGQQSEIGFAPAEALSRGITYYWKVDVTTGSARAGVFHPGKVWSFRVVDRNTKNWAATVAGDSPAYLDTFVEDGLYDIGALSGDITYEFVVRSNPDETEASMCLIGRREFGDTKAGLKYEQWNNTGTYGATLFGVVDLDYGVPTAPGEYTVLAFVSSEDAATTALYVNGVYQASVDRAITLSGLVGIGYGAQGADGSGVFDNFDGAVFGVAIYDTALSDDVIAKHSDSYFTPIAIKDPDLLIYYDFESGEGTTVLDQSGHGNHAQFFGNPEWATGIFGGALAIESDEVDYIETVAPLNIVTNTVTVTGWVKHDETPVGWSGILTHRGTSPGCLGLQQDGTELRYMWGADQYWSFSSGLLIPNGEWYFAAIAISPEQGKLYLNGIEQTATNVAEHVPTNFDGLISVGRDIGFGGDRIMTCLIDEVRLYNRTLTDVDIQRLLLSDVTAPGDIVQGVPNDGDWPGAEYPALAIDNDTSKKYLHFKGGSMATGFQVEPASGSSIVTALTFTTANDDYGRDPIAFELSGSNDSIDGPYTLIASGDIVDFAQEALWPRFTMNATPISFENDVAYKYYQVTFQVGRPNNDGLMQIAEVELLGVLGVPGPVAHWTLDDGEGTIAADSSGNGFDGILMGDPQWAIGVLGGALDFDGDGDYVDCGTNATINGLNEAITASAWINIRSVTTAWMTVMAKGENAWRIAVNNLTTGMHFGFSGGDRGWQAANSATELPLSEWHHVAATYDLQNGGRIYIDGIEDGSNPDLGGVQMNEMPFLIGENPEATGRFFDGLIDDVRIYGRALSADEVSELTALGAPANILANGGFEDGVADPWSTYGSVTTEVVTDDPAEGNYCLHVVVPAAGANFWDAGLQHAGHVFEAGKQYTLSAFLKCSQGTMDINFKPELAQDPWSGYGEQVMTMTDQWAEYSITTPVFDADVSPGCITFHIAFAPGDFWIDDVRFVEVK